MRREYGIIVKKVQQSESCHQKCIQSLYKLYKENEFERFTKYFNLFLQALFRKSEKLMFVARAVKFCARFCADLAQKEEDDDNQPFLTATIKYALKFSNLIQFECRYNSCLFIAMVLQNIGERVMLDNDLCDELQKAMLERVHDSKTAVRIKAIAAMVRLQDPSNPGCPVIRTLVNLMLDINALVRKEATRIIAPSPITMSRIKDRILDVDASVRAVAYNKLTEIGPKFYSISDKHMILTSGFCEQEKKVSDIFLNNLLPAWLRIYNDNLLQFVKALQLTAEAVDLKAMTYLSKKLIRHFYNKQSIDDIIAILPIDENRLMDLENMTIDVTLCWNLIVNLLISSEENDEYLARILPEMITFSTFIERFVAEKINGIKDEDTLAEEQFNLMNLLEIAVTYDYSDEVGRRKMQSVVQSILPNPNMSLQLVEQLVFIYGKCSSSIEFLTTEMCQIISEIKEPLAEQPISQDQNIDEFELAGLKVKINVLSEEQNEALNAREYKKAEAIEQKLIELKESVNKLREAPKVVHVQQATQADLETICRCLNVLIGVLSLPQIDRMTSSLSVCKKEFLLPLILKCGDDARWRILKCLGLFAIIDRATAEEFAKVICIPLILYKVRPDTDEKEVVQSINCINDLVRIYGNSIIGQDDPEATVQNGTKRKLYNGNGDLNMNIVEHPEKVNYTSVFQTLLEMLDAPENAIRYAAAQALHDIILHGLPVTSDAISKILLKWFHPSTGRDDQELQMRLGTLIEMFSKMKSAKSIIIDTVIPTLTSIADAPKGSPLVDIPMDNLLEFIAAVLNVILTQDELRTLALNWCAKISENYEDRIVVYLIKLLICLHIDADEKNIELAEKLKIIIVNMWNKVRKKQLEKFMAKITKVEPVETTQNLTAGTTVNGTRRTTDITENNISTEASEMSQNISNKNNEMETIISNKHNGMETLISKENNGMGTLIANKNNEMETITEALEENLSISDSDTENKEKNETKRKRFSGRKCFVRLERINNDLLKENRQSGRIKKQRLS